MKLIIKTKDPKDIVRIEQLLGDITRRDSVKPVRINTNLTGKGIETYPDFDGRKIFIFEGTEINTEDLEFLRWFRIARPNKYKDLREEFNSDFTRG